jgi:hypothetical protein
MNDSKGLVGDEAAVAAVTSLQQSVDGLLGLDVGRLSEPALIEFVRMLDGQVRRLPSVEHRALAELSARGSAERLGHRHLPNLLTNSCRRRRARLPGGWALLTVSVRGLTCRVVCCLLPIPIWPPDCKQVGSAWRMPEL